MIALLPNFGAEEGDEGGRPDLADAARLWRELFADDAVLVGHPPAPPILGPHHRPAFSWLPTRGGVPWLSTEKVARRLARLGLEPAAPDPQVVRRVHDKGFAQRVARELGLSPLGEAVRIFAPEELDRLAAAVAALPPGSAWAVKPRLGSSGRGRIAIRAGAPHTLPGALPRLARRGGAILEPWLDRIDDLSVQLHVARDGDVEVLGSTRLLLTPSGVYLGNSCVVESDGRIRAGTTWDDALEAAARAVGAAAAREGFFGPCGVDAFVYRGADGQPVLRPVVEFNARFTMGTVALGILRRLQERGERPRAFAFTLRETQPGRRIPLSGTAAAWLVDP